MTVNACGEFFKNYLETNLAWVANFKLGAVKQAGALNLENVNSFFATRFQGSQTAEDDYVILDEDFDNWWNANTQNLLGCGAINEYFLNNVESIDIQPFDSNGKLTDEAKEFMKNSLRSFVDDINNNGGILNYDVDNLKSQSDVLPANGIDESTYTFNFADDLTESQSYELDLFEQNFNKNVDKYQKVEDATGVPKELIAAIHWRESNGDFETYLHNGDPLGSPTKNVPTGIYFTDWTDAAIDAIKTHNPDTVVKGDIDTYYNFAEGYNGWGYKNNGYGPSPYVWSGTDKYKSGKYVSDGHYDPNTKDKQLGVAAMLKKLLA